MNHIKSFKLHENLTNDLIDELKNSKNINVSFINKNDGWGVVYYINGQKKSFGGFKNNKDVHEFLNDNDIDYSGKNGFMFLSKIEEIDTDKIPFPKYQKLLMKNGLEKIFDLE